MAGAVQRVGDHTWAWVTPTGTWGYSNAGLVAGGGGGPSLLVDTLFDLVLTRAMLDGFRASVPGAATIGTVVNTHANGDHCWGNELVAGAEIVASAACAEEMAELPPEVLAGMVDAARAGALGEISRFVVEIFGPFDFGAVSLTLPTRTFSDALALTVPSAGVDVRLWEVGPAHTRGDVLVEVPADGVVYTGDICFIGGHPVMWAGPVESWIAACDRILAMDIEHVVPGHGPISGKGEVRTLRQYFEDLTGAARACFDAGIDAEAAMVQVAEALGADPSYRTWGEAERVAVNVAALYQQWGADPADIVTLFGRMAALAESSP